MNLVSIDVDDSPSCTPDAKRRNVVSTPLKESCSAMLSFDDQLDETIPFETDMSDDFESHFSELYINQETQTEETQLLHEMYDLIPGVCDFLITQDPLHTERLKQFMQLMSSGNFPIKNLCYNLFNDVVQWYSCGSSTEMRYSDETKQFWCIGKRLFHGKFVQFMRGPASKGRVTSGETHAGEYEPHNSSINFAVPSNLSKMPNSKIPDRVLPGIMIFRLIELMSSSSRRIITFSAI